MAPLNRQPDVEDIEKDAKSFLEQLLGDITKASATKQLIVGASAGWVTGFLSSRIGKAAACALGGGIILLEVAHEKGYIRVNWDKVNRQVDKVSDKVEKKLTGQGPSWTSKMERYVDRKLDTVENALKKGQTDAKGLYSSIAGKPDYKLQRIHVFLASFTLGVALGVVTS